MSSIIRKNTNELIRPFRSLLSGHYNSDLLEEDFFRSTSLPAVNVKETSQQLELELAVPGMKRDEIVVKVENGMLNISAESKQEKEEKEENYTRKEFNYAAFNRSFSIPDSLDQDQISAKYEEGILQVIIAKKEENKQEAAKSISIN